MKAESTPVNSTEQWLVCLQNHGYRLTAARRLVIEIISSGLHILSPLEVYEQARLRQSGIGLVTVYRTFEKLEELGLIQRVHQPSGCQAFVASETGHHQLLICKSCRKVFYFSADGMENTLRNIEVESGFRIQDHWFQLYGLCEECQH